MPIYNLIEYSNNYSKTAGSLWQYCKDVPAVDDDGDITNNQCPVMRLTHKQTR